MAWCLLKHWGRFASYKNKFNQNLFSGILKHLDPWSLSANCWSDLQQCAFFLPSLLTSCSANSSGRCVAGNWKAQQWYGYVSQATRRYWNTSRGAKSPLRFCTLI